MASRAEPRQLALALPHQENLSREDFLEGRANAEALTLIDHWPDWPQRAMVVAGPDGSGKSHLASIWAEMSGARSTTALNLTAASVPGALATGAVVVEDIGRDGSDERALFHLLNLAREQQAFVLLTSRLTPAHMTVALHDLRSRLRAIPAIHLHAPDDVLLRAVIVKLFADRQMSVDETVVEFLINRIDRSFAAVREAVGRLDAEALQRGRPVTRVLAAELLRDD